MGMRTLIDKSVQGTVVSEGRKEDQVTSDKS